MSPDVDRLTSTNHPPSTSPNHRHPPPNRSGLAASHTSPSLARSKIPLRGGGGFGHRSAKPLLPSRTTGKVQPGYQSLRARPIGSQRPPPPPRPATPIYRSGSLNRPPTPIVSSSSSRSQTILPRSSRRGYLHTRRRESDVQRNRDDMQNGDTPGSDSCLILVIPGDAPVNLALVNSIPGAKLLHARRVRHSEFHIIQPAR